MKVKEQLRFGINYQSVVRIQVFWIMLREALDEMFK
jgi:hypothetical protein